jgi:hypothetical protein
MLQLKDESSILDFTVPGPTFGGPPDSYLVTFRGRGTARLDESQDVIVHKRHQVMIRLGASYPRMMPEMVWQTPVFHPNISSNGIVCLGGYSTHWVPSLRLDQLCEMLWDMIRYQNFDVESPYNREAAQWARIQDVFTFPLDTHPLRDRALRTKQSPATASVNGSARSVAPRTHKPKQRRYPTEGFVRPVPEFQPDEPKIQFMDNEIEIVDAELVPGGAAAEDSGILFID